MRRSFLGWVRFSRLPRVHLPRTKLRLDGRVAGLLLGGVLAVLTIHFLNGQLRPVMAELASAQIQNAMTLVIDNVVSTEISKGNVTYDDIIRLEIDGTGAVTALKSDMARVNLLRSDILNALVAEVDRTNILSMGIPLGNLTGIDLLSGRGPDIPINVMTTGSADASFENVFSSAGINQTRHQIMLDIAVPVSILLPGFTTETRVSAQVCVAETVIVGRVPETYLQFG